MPLHHRWVTLLKLNSPSALKWRGTRISAEVNHEATNASEIQKVSQNAHRDGNYPHGEFRKTDNHVFVYLRKRRVEVAWKGAPWLVATQPWTQCSVIG